LVKNTKKRGKGSNSGDRAEQMRGEIEHILATGHLSSKKRGDLLELGGKRYGCQSRKRVWITQFSPGNWLKREVGENHRPCEN